MLHYNILLADDDVDDCLLFKEALDEIPLQTQLTTVHNGEQLMQLLAKPTSEQAHVLFLDMNMPRKKGYECLSEIKKDDTLKKLPVIILTTSFDKDIANKMYECGAHYYLRKPDEFSKLKDVIHHILTILRKNDFAPSTKENFVLLP